MNIFEKAVRTKLRFTTSKGLLTVEDLFDLTLTSQKGISLDSISRDILREKRETQEESLVSETTTNNTELNLKLEILQFVIDVKKAERLAAKEEAEKKVRKQKILDVLARKQDAELEGSSIEQLEAELAELTAL